MFSTSEKWLQINFSSGGRYIGIILIMGKIIDGLLELEPRVIDGLHDGLWIAVSVSAAVLILLFTILVICCCLRFRRQKKIENMEKVDQWYLLYKGEGYKGEEYNTVAEANLDYGP